MTEILILYYSRDGATTNMAQHIARGVERVAYCHARLRSTPCIDKL